MPAAEPSAAAPAARAPLPPRAGRRAPRAPQLSRLPFPPPLGRQALVTSVEEIANAGAGDARARASLLSFLPPLLREYRDKVLDVDASAAATSLLEKLVHALRSVDAAHPAVKETIAAVSKRLQEARAAAAAPPPPT